MPNIGEGPRVAGATVLDRREEGVFLVIVLLVVARSRGTSFCLSLVGA